MSIIELMKNNNISDLEKSLESLYLKKDYVQNIELLLKNSEHFGPGQFHYNLGTLHAKLQNFAAARFNLEKAYKLGQIDTKNINNLDYVREQLVVSDVSNSNNRIDNGMNIMVGISPDLYLFCTLLLLLCVSCFWLKKKLTSLSTLAVCISLSLIPFLGSKFYFSNFNYAVNLKQIQVYEGPSKVYEKKMEIDAGSKFLITGPTNGWYFIEKPISLSGWIEKKDIGIL